LTVSPAVVDPLTLVLPDPPAPETVIVAEPIGVLDDVETASADVAVELEVTLTDAGVKVADAPLGRPLAVSATAPA
jgi:hypothetical protein